MSKKELQNVIDDMAKRHEEVLAKIEKSINATNPEVKITPSVIASVATGVVAVGAFVIFLGKVLGKR